LKSTDEDIAMLEIKQLGWNQPKTCGWTCKQAKKHCSSINIKHTYKLSHVC